VSLYDKKLNCPTDWGKMTAEFRASLDLLESTLYKAIGAGYDAFHGFELSDDDQKTLIEARASIKAYPAFADHFDALIDKCKDVKAIKVLVRKEETVKERHAAKLAEHRKVVHALEQGAVLAAVGAFNATIMPKAVVTGNGHIVLTGKVYRHEAQNRKAFVVFAQDHDKDKNAGKVRIMAQVVGFDDLAEIPLPDGFVLKSATKARMALSMCLLHSHSKDMTDALAEWHKDDYPKKDSKGVGRATATGHNLFVDCGLSVDWLKRVES
jgi:hypothetical protein